MTNPNAAQSADLHSSLGAMVFGHVVLFIFCVGLPAIFTAASPLTSVQLTRESGAIRADVSKRLLFVVPYSRKHIDNVEAVDNYAVAGVRNPSRSTASQTSATTQTENSAFLTINGGNDSAKIEVSPTSIANVRARIETFLTDTAQRRLRLTTVANWKFSIAGGVLSLLTVFYIYLQLSSITRSIHGSAS